MQIAISRLTVSVVHILSVFCCTMATGCIPATAKRMYWIGESKTVIQPSITFPFAGKVRGNIWMSPDQRYVLTSSPLALWSPTTGKQVLTLDASGEQVTDAAWSHNGKWVAGLTYKQTSNTRDQQQLQTLIRIWDLSSGMAVHNAVVHVASMRSLKFSLDDTSLIWFEYPMLQGKVLSNGPPPLNILPLEFTQDGKPKSNIITTMAIDENEALAISSNRFYGPRWMTCLKPDGLSVFDVDDDWALDLLTPAWAGFMYTVHPEFLLHYPYYWALFEYDMRDGTKLSKRVFPKRYKSNSFGLNISPDGKKIAISIESETFVVDLQNNKCLGSLGLGHYRAFKVAFSPDSKQLIGTPDHGDAACIWDLPKSKHDSVK